MNLRQTKLSNISDIQFLIGGLSLLGSSGHFDDMEKLKMVALVPEGKINIDRLQAIILKSTERLQSLKQQWAEHRNPHDQHNTVQVVVFVFAVGG